MAVFLCTTLEKRHFQFFVPTALDHRWFKHFQVHQLFPQLHPGWNNSTQKDSAVSPWHPGCANDQQNKVNKGSDLSPPCSTCETSSGVWGPILGSSVTEKSLRNQGKSIRELPRWLGWGESLRSEAVQTQRRCRSDSAAGLQPPEFRKKTQEQVLPRGARQTARSTSENMLQGKNFTMRMVKKWKRCPELLGNVFPWRTKVLVSNYTCFEEEAGLSVLQRSPPSSLIL